MFTVFFCEGPVTTWAEVADADATAYADFFHSMLDRGVYLAPSQFESAFASLAHTADDLATASERARDALVSPSFR
jgi:glutamate-1-semialdehyde 2,1-aminomutase